MKKFGNRLSLVLVPWLYRLLAALLFGSCRIRYCGGYQALRERVRQGRPVVVSFWHYGVLFICHARLAGKWVAMVSASRDGEYIARILEGLGVKAVRGSRNRGGVGALKGMIAAMQEGRCAAIVADGSQGPARQAQPGAVLLASRSGCPMVPVSWSAERYWSFRSWDRTILPKPFARITIWIGEPIPVPSGVKSDGVEPYRVQLEQALNETYVAAWREVGREGH